MITNADVLNEIFVYEQRISELRRRRIEIDGLAEQALMKPTVWTPADESVRPSYREQYSRPFGLTLIETEDYPTMHQGAKWIGVGSGLIYGGTNAFHWPNPADVEETEFPRYFLECPTHPDIEERIALCGQYLVRMYVACDLAVGDWPDVKWDVSGTMMNVPGPVLELSKHETGDAPQQQETTLYEILGRVLVVLNEGGENVFCMPEQYKRDHIYGIQWHWWPNECGDLYAIALQCPATAVNVNHGHAMIHDEFDGEHVHEVDFSLMATTAGSEHSHVLRMMAADGTDAGIYEDEVY